MRLALARILRARERPERSVERAANLFQLSLNAQLPAQAAVQPYGATERAFFNGSVMIW